METSAAKIRINDGPTRSRHNTLGYNEPFFKTGAPAAKPRRQQTLGYTNDFYKGSVSANDNNETTIVPKEIHEKVMAQMPQILNFKKPPVLKPVPKAPLTAEQIDAKVKQIEFEVLYGKEEGQKKLASYLANHAPIQKIPQPVQLAAPEPLAPHTRTTTLRFKPFTPDPLIEYDIDLSEFDCTDYPVDDNHNSTILPPDPIKYQTTMPNETPFEVAMKVADEINQQKAEATAQWQKLSLWQRVKRTFLGQGLEKKLSSREFNKLIGGDAGN